MKVYSFNVQLPKNLILDAKSNFEVLSLCYDGANIKDLTDIELLALELIKQYLKAKQDGDVETVELKTK